MPKSVFTYENGVNDQVVESKSQLIELTGLSIRSIQRKLDDKGMFTGFVGNVWYKVRELPFNRDKRVKNGNKNF